MTKYIECEKVIEAFDDPAVERYYGDVCPESVISVIEQIPAADVRPVVRGRWVEFETDWPPRRNRCSECGYTTNPWLAHVYNFCPNCGADMREPLKEE